MTRDNRAAYALLLAGVVGLAALVGITLPVLSGSGRFSTSRNAVANGDFSDSASITYIQGFRLGPVDFCPSPQGNPSPIVHRWGMLHAANDIMIGNRSSTLFGVSTVESRSAFVAGITSGQGGRISLLQLLGQTKVNSSTRVHFAVNSLNSTGQVYSSIILVLGPIWQSVNVSSASGFSVVFHFDSLPNMSGWYDFDFSLPALMQGLTGKSFIGSTFGGPCLNSRGISLGLETASILDNSVFRPSPPLGLALTDVAVYDSSSGRDTMFKGSPFHYYLNETDSSLQSKVSITTYNLAFPIP